MLRFFWTVSNGERAILPAVPEVRHHANALHGEGYARKLLLLRLVRERLVLRVRHGTAEPIPENARPRHQRLTGLLIPSGSQRKHVWCSPGALAIYC